MTALAADAPALGRPLTDLRRTLHRQAETGLDLPRTQATVLHALEGLGLEVTTGQGASSVVAVLRGGGRTSGRSVLLRGDMDALPLTEETGLEYAAPDGVMHACGHDLHTAGLVGAARLLSGRRDLLDGDVIFMFQPGEEGYDGAAVMLAEGVLQASGTEPTAAYGLHVFSNLLPRGVFGTRPGPLMAASAGLFVTVHGRGGHASRPHVSADPIAVAAELVGALQTMVTRQFDVFDPVVVTVGLFQAGTRRNIIPGQARFEATVRALSQEAMTRAAQHAVRLCEQIAAAHGLRAEAEFVEEYPVTVNDDAHAERALQSAAELFGPGRAVTLPEPMMGSEDFSRILQRVPGAFVFLGATPAADPSTAPSNHSPLARFDDSVLPDAALLLAELAVRALADPVRTGE